MAELGDPEYRPQETLALAASKGAMEEALVRYSTHAVVACLFQDRGGADPDRVKRAICSRLGVQDGDVKVVHHKPEDFIIIFQHLHHRDMMLDKRHLPVSNGHIKMLP